MFPDPPVRSPLGVTGVLDESFGLRCWQGVPAPMAAAHRHDDVEVNVVTAGEVVYLFGGRSVRVAAGTAAAFWATVPHQLIEAAPGTRSHWLTVPMGLVLGWPLPPAARDRLLGAEPLLDTGPAAADVAPVLFGRWADDLEVGGERREAALLEVHAWLRRRAAADGSPAAPAAAVGTRPAVRHAVTMATYVAHHSDGPLTVAEVAAAAHLHPHHAMTVFRQVTGTTIGDYLTRCRVAAAQRLLLASDLPVSEVGIRAGFTSASRFYAVFRSVVGVPPGRYRRRPDAAG